MHILGVSRIPSISQVEAASSAKACSAGPPLMEAIGIYAGYGDVAVVRDVSMEVLPGEIVALLGPNGAGKTTTLLTLAGDLQTSAGEVRLYGRTVTDSLYRRARQGLAMVPEERAVIPGLSVRDNLKVGRGSIDDAFDVFPMLRSLSKRKAALLSGGEQQMLGLARAIAARPKVMLIDEVSMGLAPLVVQHILDTLRTVVDETAIGVILVEQQIRRALAVADRGYVLARGQIVLQGDAANLSQRSSEIESSYLAGPSAATPLSSAMSNPRSEAVVRPNDRPH